MSVTLQTFHTLWFPSTSFHAYSGAALNRIFLLTGIPYYELATLVATDNHFHAHIVVASLKIV